MSEMEYDRPRADRVAEWFAGKPAAPYSIEVSPTMACNVNCKFCRRKDELPDYYRRAKDLSDERWFQILSDAIAGGTRRLFFRGGGDPSLKRRLLARLFPLVKDKVYCTILTNGTLIDEALAEGFVRARWNQIIVSLHGGDAETHDYITDQPGSFAAVERSLERVNRFKSLHGEELPTLSFHVVLTRRSYAHIDTIIEFGRANGVGDIGVFPMHNAPYPEYVRDLEMREEDKRAYAALVPGYKKLLESYGMKHDFQLDYQGGGANPPPKPAPAPIDSSPALAPDGSVRLERLPCYFPWYHAALTPNGFVSPCCYGEGKQSKGMLERISFMEGWRGYDMAEVRETMLRGGLMPYCQLCPNWFQDNNRRMREIFAAEASR